MYESLPATILNQFKNFNVKNQNNRFYFLKLQQATKNGIVIEIKAVHGQKGDNIDCHKYINMGYFEANIFHRYLMDSKYICYRNATCFQVQANQCTSNFDHFNCTKDSLHTCSCDPTDLSNCQIESEIASSNFVFVQQFKQFVVASTNAKTYTISRSTGSSTKTVGGSGVLVTSLNEYDSLIIGGVTVRGRSKDPTKIYGFIHTEFTVAPLPTTQAPKIYTYDKDGIADFVFDWWIHIVCVLALIVFVIVFYKKCM
uniref:Peptidylprolyl isomerase n=1 Tax=Panagrolaimus davidi TaxID=227884 RepID=A0A914PFY6_9BILA